MDYRDNYYKGIAKIYFDMVLNKIIKIGSMREEKGLSLDHGCGFGHLKKKLSETGADVVGYDIIEEFLM